MTNAYILLKIFGRTPLLLVLNIHFVLFDKVWTLGNPLQQQIRCQYTFFSVALMKYGRGFRHPCTVFHTVSP